jgi:UDP-3-O-[3-hydroxymyristoyl] glucosamine N-acyltransferase
MSNPFFINQGPYDILEILKLLNLNSNNFQKRNVHDVKDLLNASNNDLTFFHSKKYKELANLKKQPFVSPQTV